MSAKPILIVRLSKKYPIESTERVSKIITKKNKDYNVVVLHDGFEETTFEVLNGEFSNKIELP
jgi:predicted deacetylase